MASDWNSNLEQRTTRTTIERELRDRLSVLAPEQQRQVLEYARALGTVPQRGIPGSALLRFAGTIPEEDLAAIRMAVEEGCEGIDAGGW